MKKFKFLSILTVIIVLSSCGKKDIAPDNSGGTNPLDTTKKVIPPFDINNITDTYGSIASFDYHTLWGSYNVHDPSIKKFGDYYYCYSTDVGYGTSVPAGIQVRKSKDLVQWTFVGWVFNGLPSMGANYITSSGGTPYQALWAPYIMKVGNEYRLYYALSCALPRLSVIGLATSSSPEGPWTERGIVETSKNDNTVQTNAIDPTVVVTPTGEHWMYYGSGWDGIYVLKLDAATGLAASNGDKGKRIANRGFTGGKYNGNIEGPEVIYNPTLNKYYLFISYDWLQTKYNVRVGRGDSPKGPFYDYIGHDINLNEDHGPMIVAPYQFNGHSGWQGTAHCAVFDDGNGQYYMAHQGRPGSDTYYMDLHVRKMFWTADGWPIVEPERYANVLQTAIPQSEVVGTYEQIVLGYTVVPGYGGEQLSPNFQTSVPLTLTADGKINADAASSWTYAAPWLQLNWANGFTDKVYVSRERDWENKVTSTLVFAGLNNAGTAVWGKKK